MDFSVNDIALQIVSPILDNPRRYGAEISRSPGGATVVDLGVHAPGSWLAARLFVESAFGGLAEVTFGRMAIKELEVVTVSVVIDDPMLSVVACHGGAWKLGEGEFAAMGSGPARARARADRWARKVDYRDPSNHALLHLQMPALPDDNLLQRVADACEMPQANLVAVVAPSASLVGSVQVASRAFEQCLVALGRTTDFDVSTVVHGDSTAPVAPVVDGETMAFGRINDALVYGGMSTLWVRHADDEAVRRATESIPFSKHAGEYYGRSYRELFEAYNRSIYNVPANLDAPAKMTMLNLATGSAFTAGEINIERLYQSFTESRAQIQAA